MTRSTGSYNENVGPWNDVGHEFVHNVFATDAMAGEDKQDNRKNLCIENFRADTAVMPGFEAKGGCNLNRWMALKKQQAPKKNFALGRAAVHEDSRHVMIATAHDRHDQLLMCVDAEVALNGEMRDPIVGLQQMTQTTQPIIGTRWVANDRVISAVVSANESTSLQVHSVKMDAMDANSSYNGMELLEITPMSESYVREFAVNKMSTNWIAYGGEDKTLTLLDLNHHPKICHRIAVDGTIGSVKWQNNFSRNCHVSLTTDEGKFMLFDVTTGAREPVFQFNSKDCYEALYAHERISENSILLGYEDGAIREIDVRFGNKILAYVRDPYVAMIGDIVYNQRSDTMAVSGLTDFSVWHNDTSTGRTDLWFHSEDGENTLSNDTNSTCHAVFLDDETVISTSCSGMEVCKTGEWFGVAKDDAFDMLG